MAAAALFPLRLELPWSLPLRLLGVRAGAAQVTLADGELRARFGRMEVRTPLSNVAGYQLTGPYRWWRAIGPRGSLADAGFTFGTSAHGGVCLCFREHVDFRGPRGPIEALTVTVDDVERLAEVLEAIDIHGEDRRTR